jgi:hypothetical protein
MVADITNPFSLMKYLVQCRGGGRMIGQGGPEKYFLDALGSYRESIE